MAVPVSELQAINPTAIVELFQLHLDSTLHGSSDIHYFYVVSHSSGSYLNS